MWRLDEDRALVVTVDVITPLVDDARTWGRIAAANAVSDVYAMGGRPLLALNIVGWNRDELSLDLLSEVLAGGADMAARGGWVNAGGHTIDDPEPKYGQAVIGEVAPDRILRNSGLRHGDALVLTKPLGTGIFATAMKAGSVPDELHTAAVESMTRLNDDASSAALAAEATGATDITGFGLLGHARRMAEEARVDLEIAAASVPILPGVIALATDGVVPGGSRRNLDWARARLDVTGDVDEVLLSVLGDAQTSGGLLFGARPAAAHEAVARLREQGHDAAVIGSVRDGSGRVEVRDQRD